MKVYARFIPAQSALRAGIGATAPLLLNAECTNF